MPIRAGFRTEFTDEWIDRRDVLQLDATVGDDSAQGKWYILAPSTQVPVMVCRADDSREIHGAR